MQVFCLASDAYPDTDVDTFVEEPFEFSVEHAAAEVHMLAPGARLPLVRLSTLIDMKRKTGRSTDTDDVRHLCWIAEERGEGTR